MLDLCASQIIWQLLVFPHPGHTPTQIETRSVLPCSLWSEYVAGLSLPPLTLKYQVGVSQKWYPWSCPVSWQITWIFEVPGEQRPIITLLQRNETGSSNCAPVSLWKDRMVWRSLKSEFLLWKIAMLHVEENSLFLDILFGEDLCTVFHLFCRWPCSWQSNVLWYLSVRRSTWNECD